MKRLGLILITIFSLSCKDNSKILEQEAYEGPSSVMANIDVIVTEFTIPKMRLVAAKMEVYEDQDQDYPDGIYLEFFDEIGEISSTLKAEKGHFFAQDNYYTAEGNVLLRSRSSNDELTTELLNWVPKDERIHTDKFVTITQDGEVLTGEGLEASQDFKEYTIIKPNGTMSVIPSENGQDSLSDNGFDDSLEFEEIDQNAPQNKDSKYY